MPVVSADSSRARERWRVDRAGYGPRPWLREQSIWAVATLRFGQYLDERPARSRRAALLIYWLAHRVVETLTGIGMTKNVEVGGGLRIYHFGGIFIAEGVRIGSRCTLRQGVTIGERRAGGDVPVLGDDVDIGAYAQVLGGVHVGDGARIGALSLVLHDVPAGATVVGNPARVVSRPGGIGH